MLKNIASSHYRSVYYIFSIVRESIAHLSPEWQFHRIVGLEDLEGHLVQPHTICMKYTVLPNSVRYVSPFFSLIIIKTNHIPKANCLWIIMFCAQTLCINCYVFLFSNSNGHIYILILFLDISS